MVIFVKAGGLSAYHTSHCVALTDDDMLCGREGGECYLPQSTPFFSLVDSELLTTLVGDDMLSILWKRRSLFTPFLLSRFLDSQRLPSK